MTLFLLQDAVCNLQHRAFDRMGPHRALPARLSGKEHLQYRRPYQLRDYVFDLTLFLPFAINLFFQLPSRSRAVFLTVCA